MEKKIKVKKALVNIGEFLNDMWYILSPFLFFKLFQMILITEEFTGVIWTINYCLLLVICYGVSIYRVYILYFIKLKGGQKNE